MSENRSLSLVPVKLQDAVAVEETGTASLAAAKAARATGLVSWGNRATNVLIVATAGVL